MTVTCLGCMSHRAIMVDSIGQVLYHHHHDSHNNNNHKKINKKTLLDILYNYVKVV